jgi:hypothetical protein
MPGCEKCWRDAQSPFCDEAEEYARLIKERDKSGVCSPEEQAGEHASDCPKCTRKTLHQHCGICMACGFDPEAPT